MADALQFGEFDLRAICCSNSVTQDVCGPYEMAMKEGHYIGIPWSHWSTAGDDTGTRSLGKRSVTNALIIEVVMIYKELRIFQLV